MTEIITLIIMILLSGFFSGLEIALFSLGPAHVESMVKKKIRGALLVKKLKENPEHLLVVILIGNNIANIGAASLAEVGIDQGGTGHADGPSYAAADDVDVGRSPRAVQQRSPTSSPRRGREPWCTLRQ